MNRTPRLSDVPLSIQFLIVFVVSIVMPLLFGSVLSFQALNEQMTQRVQSIRQANLNQIGRNTDQLIEQTVNLTNYLVLSTDIADFLDADLGSMTDYQIFQTYTEMTSVFTRVGASFVAERVFMIISNFDGNSDASWAHWNQDFNRMQEAPWFPASLEEVSANINVVGFVDNFVESERLDSLFLVYRVILDPIDRRRKGMVFVALPGHEVLRVLSVEREFDSTSRAIVSADGERLVALEPLDDARSSGRRITATYQLNRGGLTLVESIDEREVLSEVRAIQLRLLYVVLGVFAAFSGFGLIVSRSITGRIRRLAAAAESVQRDTLNMPVATDARDELGVLSRSIQTMMHRIRDLVATVYKEQADLRRFELELLQNQMHPHFLFNALHSIQTMATLSRAPNVAELTGALTNVLYHAVRSSDECIPLSEELSILESYVLIQKMRWADAFEYVAEVPEELFAAKVPKFVLQPLVENSIRHGFRGRTAAGRITLSGTVDGDTLCLTVKDNGAGFSDEAFSQWSLSGDEQDATGGERSVGLANVSRRIQLMYGEQFGLTVMRVKTGAEVMIRMPYVV